MEHDVGIGEDGARTDGEQIGIAWSAPARTTSPIDVALCVSRAPCSIASASAAAASCIAVAEHRRRAGLKQPPVRALLRVARDAGAAKLRRIRPINRVNGPHSSPIIFSMRSRKRTRQKRALTGGRDGDLQGAALHQRGSDPVALMGHVGHVEEDALAVRLCPRCALRGGIITCVDGEIRADQVTGSERTPEVNDGCSAGAEP